MSKLLDRIIEEAVNEAVDEVFAEEEQKKENKVASTVKVLRNWWEAGDSRKFMRAAYMRRETLESINERYIDALELINGYERPLVRETLMSNLLDFTEKYAKGEISKELASGTVLFSIQMIQDGVN